MSCGVPGGALPSDGGVGPACETSRDCEDGARCTSDTCTGGRCVRTLEDSLCDDNPGGICAPDDPGSNMEGCIYRACDPELCEVNETNPSTCEVGVCDEAIDGCVATVTCEAGESCCGDGTCRDCDDDNPCTEDSCAPGGCVNRPLEALPCNDGNPCTVSDTCDASGACNGTTCEELSATLLCETGVGCVGCTEDAHCPDDVPGWGPCQFGAIGTAEACDGVERREVRRGRCVSRMCDFELEPQMQTCTQSSNDVRCGGDVVGGFSACDYAPPTPPATLSCDNNATRTRSRTIFRCDAGTTNCSARMQMNASDTEACTRNQDGMTCRDDVNGAWGPCMQNNATTCAGMQSRMVTTYACGGGNCNGTNGTGTRSCMVTNGTTTCGTATTVTCGATPCVASGPNPCTGTCRDDIITPTCTPGGCTMVTTMSAPHACNMPMGTMCGPGREAPGPCTQTGMTCMGTQVVTIFDEECNATGTCGDVPGGTRNDACNMPSGTTCSDGNDNTCMDVCGNRNGVCAGSACPDAGPPDTGIPDVGLADVLVDGT